MHDFSIDRSWLDAVVREAVKQALETVMELEREVFLAEWGGKKNGYYERGLVTKHGPVRLRVPRERDGRFHTALFAPYRRRMEDLEAFCTAALNLDHLTRQFSQDSHPLSTSSPKRPRASGSPGPSEDACGCTPGRQTAPPRPAPPPGSCTPARPPTPL